MRVPLDWLAEWIDLPDSAEDLAERLTVTGLEVDAIERSGPDLSALRVGLVLERQAHPNADRLSLCRVDWGAEEPASVVCGAPNVAAGQKIAFAPVGTVLPDGTRLKKARIRGESSAGMICSERELGLGDGHEGILVLDPEAPVGAPLDRVVRAGTTVLEIAITPNRGDCASILGIAREVQALFGGALRWPELAPPEAGRGVDEDVAVGIEDAQGCWRYDARVVRDVSLPPSPDWMQRRLEAVGLRPRNAVVDVTNYVMWELGQPLHAFDLERVRGGRIRVRSAAAGEPLVTLDGERRSLEPDDLVIADAEGAVALAGVMGGADSEVGANTRHVLLESAHFDPARVRRSARRLGLASEASYRFERGVDREGVGRAADRAARLLAELAGGQVSRGVATAQGRPPAPPGEIPLAPERVNRILGTAFPPRAVRESLERVGVSCREVPEGLACAVPSHRNDLAIPEDLVEEVARIQGLDQVPARPQVGDLVEGESSPAFGVADRVRDLCWAEGWTEVQTFPFLDPRSLERLGLAPDDPRRRTLGVRNPIAESESQLRSTLLPSLLRVAVENRNRQVDRVAIFEVARVFRVEKEGELPKEELFAAAVLTQGEEAHLWQAQPTPPLFFLAKGSAERLLDGLGYAPAWGEGADAPYLHPGASAALRVGRRPVGWVGELHPDVAERFGVDAPCAAIEVCLSALEGLPRRERRYREVSRHPQVRRDLAVLVDRDRAAAELLEAIRRKGGEALVSAEVFDRYEGEGIPRGRVSLAFRLVFQRLDRTLTDAEVAKSVDRVVEMLSNRFGAELRQGGEP